MMGNHSRHTYPADKMLPKAPYQNKEYNTDLQDEKHFHTRKSRRWLKNELRIEVNNLN